MLATLEACRFVYNWAVEDRKALSVRIHDCPYCGYKADRDVNSAREILKRGLAKVRTEPSGRAMKCVAR